MIVVTAAVADTTIDRNAIASTISVTPMMYSRKIGIRLRIWSAMPLKAAVKALTYAKTFVKLRAPGTNVFRSVAARMSVAASCGADLGVTKMIAPLLAL